MNPNHHSSNNELTRAEAQVLIRDTVKETLLMLGVSVDDPIQVQKDFQHLRDWRETTEAVKKKALLTVMGVLVTGIAGLVVVWVKSIFAKM